MKLYGVLLGVSLISGCVLSPGQKLDLGDGWQSGQSDVQEQIIVRDITPRTVLELEEAARQTVLLPPELVAFKPTEYRLAPGDALTITVWDHPELTLPAGQFQVEQNLRTLRSDGTLYFPFVGTIRASGLTVDELRAELAQKLSPYIKNPQLDLSVARYGSQRVILTGAFANTNPITLTNVPLSLAEAIGRSGINLADADLSGLTLRRDGKEFLLNLDAINLKGLETQRLFLKHGDVLSLPYNDRKKVFVMGEVQGSRALSYKTTDISLTEALGMVSGLRSDTAKASDVFVIRRPKDPNSLGADVYRMNANSPVAWVMGNRFKLVPGDVIYVDTAGIVRFNRGVSSLFSLSFLVQTARNIVQ